MGILQPLGNGQGFLKGGTLGFPKSGKTLTSTLLLIAVKRMMSLPGPIVIFDTEGGSEYVSPLIKALTGENPIGLKSRSLDDLIKVARECVDIGAAGLLGDSMTHVWRELCESYLKQVNDARRKAAENKGWTFTPKKNLEFQDWGPIKSVWAKWTDLYLNGPFHVCIAGRAGYEYDMQLNEETDKKELVKTGIKMKTEGEFGFEPSLLFEMERDQVSDGSGGFKIKRKATVLGDRFNTIDGQSCYFASETDPEKMLAAVVKFFEPHLLMLRQGAHTNIDMTVKTETGADEGGDGEWHREKKTRVILAEEIQAELLAKFPSQSAEHKMSKMLMVKHVFGTGSWTRVESMNSHSLADGLSKLRAILASEPETASVTKVKGEAA